MTPSDNMLPPDTPWWAKLLVDGWQDCWKWLSSWMMIVAAAAPQLYENVADIQNVVTPTQFHQIETLLVVLIFLGRIKRQGG